MSIVSDHFIKAASYAFCFAFFVTAMNLCAKLAGQVFPPEQIVFFRNVLVFVFLLAGLGAMRRIAVLKTKRPGVHVVRSVVGTASLFMGFWAYTLLPLAVATSLVFTQPLWVTLLAPLLLKEQVGIRRIAAVFAGFGGVLVIAWPTIQAVWEQQQSDISLKGIVVGLVTGFLNGLVSICLRWAGKTESAVATVFYFMMIGCLITAFSLPFTGVAVPLENTGLLLVLLGLGVFGFGTQYCQTQSYRYGDASLVTPISYTMIVWAGLFDYFIWHKLPGVEVVIGSVIIISSNLFILWREQVNKKKEAVELE